MSLILASTSPRRKELLSLITTDFEVVASDFDESALTAADPRQTAENLAFGKCMVVARDYPEHTVIGCDTVVDCGGKVFGKPRDKEDARRMLKALSGTDHYVHTGVCVWHEGASHSFTATTRVRFFPLSDEQIEAYISTDEPYDKAGGYGIQGWAARHITGIDGCFYNVMGFPVRAVYEMLHTLGQL